MQIIPSFLVDKGFFLPLRLSCKERLFSKTYPSFLTLKEGSTSHLGLLSSGEKKETALLGARNRFALRLADHQRSSPCCAGWDRLGMNVSVQKCHNAPICGLCKKPANLIFKYLSLKISLIQADCHWKQVLIVRSTRFHGLEQSLEILPERDSDLLASLDKGIVHCRSQCTLNTSFNIS